MLATTRRAAGYRFVLVRVSTAVMKCHERSTLKRKRVISLCSYRSSREVRQEAETTERVLPTDSFLMASSACFFIPPTAVSAGVQCPQTAGLSIISSIQKMHPRFAHRPISVAFFQSRFPLDCSWCQLDRKGASIVTWFGGPCAQ